MSESGTTWYLKGKLKDNSPWIVPINAQPFTIGRLEGSDLILSSSTVSRRHTQITIHRGDPYIVDLGSKNGTYVNGDAIHEQTRLKNDDIIRIGSIEFAMCESSEVNPEDELDYTAADANVDYRQDFGDYYQLSDREKEVLYFLLKGMSIKKIADQLFISPGTAKNHALKIYKKTKCHTRIELVTNFNDFATRH
ncbi:MAG: FHA domain-containing protein [Spirochaetales bacterium]|nr:FHA domain-containing protein [Spirochaetales bacterium]